MQIPTDRELVPGEAEFGGLIDFTRGRTVAVLSGAGCSTESGIPDYRGPGTAARAKNPIQFREFVRSPEARARYWARSSVGWQRVARARPNLAHSALAQLERAGVVRGIVTQNVDRLHHAAGSRRVIELHGALSEVRCLDCGALESRTDFQDRLLALNPYFEADACELRPDGDAELAPGRVSGFVVAGCAHCGGVMKPNVVFFGESVPRPLVEQAYALVEEAGGLIVVGSSLTVFSGFRFVKRAAERGVPIAIVNLGATRGDALARLCINAPAGRVLDVLALALG